MERSEAKRVVEVLLYMTDHPVTLKEICEVLDSNDFSQGDVQAIIDEIRADYDASGSGLSVMNVAGGSQVATRSDMAPWIRRLYKERLTVRLSVSALETLSIVAYKQPIARSEVEQIRGVEATGVMDTLLERRLIKVVGRKETIGRPLLYGTTIDFLRQFGLKHLSELPDLAAISASDVAEADQGDETDGEIVSVPAGRPEPAPEPEAVLVGAEAAEAAPTSDEPSPSGDESTAQN